LERQALQAALELAEAPDRPPAAASSSSRRILFEAES
jgi:hypothetical protein